MTNEMIIFMESQKLAEAGKINYTGRTFKAVNMAGEVIEYKETETIHTFQAWKAQGFSVKKGSKAVAQFPIWKHTSKKETLPMEDGTSEEVETSKMFMKVASFFSASQVEKMMERR